MSRDKQIEEMAKAIWSEYDCVIPCQSCAYYAYANCRDVKSAEKLYNAGYRKVVEQSETARECKEGVDNGFSSSVTESVTRADLAEEIFAEIEKVAEVGRIMNACAIVSLDAIAELKKKYIGEDTNVPTNTEEGK